MSRRWIGPSSSSIRRAGGAEVGDAVTGWGGGTANVGSGAVGGAGAAGGAAIPCAGDGAWGGAACSGGALGAADGAAAPDAGRPARRDLGCAGCGRAMSTGLGASAAATSPVRPSSTCSVRAAGVAAFLRRAGTFPPLYGCSASQAEHRTCFT